MDLLFLCKFGENARSFNSIRMAKFLTTKQISSELEELIREADKVLYLVSPYLKLSKDFQELINSRNKNEKKTVIIYGKSDLTPEQLKFLTSLRFVYLKFHEHLHAKAYLNDNKLILGSMNFYEFSMMNNKEMGVLFDKNNSNDEEIYTKALDNIRFIEDNSNDKPFELRSVELEKVGKTQLKSEPVLSKQTKTNSKVGIGFCIRTGVEIPFNLEKPFSAEGYRKWNEYGNIDYPEKYCHFSGELSNGETSMDTPIMRKNWKKAKEIYNL